MNIYVYIWIYMCIYVDDGITLQSVWVSYNLKKGELL